VSAQARLDGGQRGVFHIDGTFYHEAVGEEKAMTLDEYRVQKATVTLADGRPLMYFGGIPERPADYPDRRQLAAVRVQSQARWDRLLGEWVVIAGHRQDRTFQPADNQCPLCPSSADSYTEIPAPVYEVAVFENRFPTLKAASASDGDQRSEADGHRSAPGAGSARTAAGGLQGVSRALLSGRPAGGRCEVVCFSQRHAASFADLSPRQVATVMAAWADRSAELAGQPGVEQVYCFENRGAEIGATLSHPHGQIYAYPYITPRTDRMLASCASYRRESGRNLFDDLLAAERADRVRIVLEGSHWTAFVPYAAHWPYEVHLYPHLRVPGLTALAEPARAEFCELYIDLLRRFDRLFDGPAPYISAWHQAPIRRGDDFALHLELFTMKRAPSKLKYLAGSESGMGAFANDVSPEAAAHRLRQLG
jgi:UDPglucose--hexose-1-phosphate uridylyltransferase